MKLEIRTSCRFTLQMEGDTVKVEILDNRHECQDYGIWRGVKRLLRRVLPHAVCLKDGHADSNRNHQCNTYLEIHTDCPICSFRGYTTNQASKGQGNGSTASGASQDSLMSGLDLSKL